MVFLAASTLIVGCSKHKDSGPTSDEVKAILNSKRLGGFEITAIQSENTKLASDGTFKVTFKATAKTTVDYIQSADDREVFAFYNPAKQPKRAPSLAPFFKIVSKAGSEFPVYGTFQAEYQIDRWSFVPTGIDLKRMPVGIELDPNDARELVLGKEGGQKAFDTAIAKQIEKEAAEEAAEEVAEAKRLEVRAKALEARKRIEKQKEDELRPLLAFVSETFGNGKTLRGKWLGKPDVPFDIRITSTWHLGAIEGLVKHASGTILAFSGVINYEKAAKHKSYAGQSFALEGEIWFGEDTEGDSIRRTIWLDIVVSGHPGLKFTIERGQFISESGKCTLVPATTSGS